MVISGGVGKKLNGVASREQDSETEIRKISMTEV